MERLVTQGTELLEEAAEAHHQAFAATNGNDPKWPTWYARYLEARLPAITGRTKPKQVLSRRLRELDEEYRASKSKQPWARFYAERLT